MPDDNHSAGRLIFLIGVVSSVGEWVARNGLGGNWYRCPPRTCTVGRAVARRMAVTAHGVCKHEEVVVPWNGFDAV